MADWALVIGINKYDRLRSLDYAERDAALMHDFFQNEARFEQIFYFSDTSPDFYAPDGSPQSTRPTYANLRSFLRDFFEEPYLQAGDNFWFFFSGHGIRHQDRDYLMPCDANPRDVEYTAISISYVTERLRRCGADNVVLLLDACRNEGEKAGLGIGGEKQQGVITICSCSPKEKSYEIEEIGQGAFTYALLESLRIQGEGNCATVERLYQRLRYRVAEINRDYNKPEQTPYGIVEPASKYHLILLPRQATYQDIVTLKLDAQEAELKKDNKLAEQLWIRILALSPSDPQALESLKRLWEQPRTTISPQPPPTDEDDSLKESNDSTPPRNAETVQQLRQPTAPSQTNRPLKKPAIAPTSWKIRLIGLITAVMGISALAGVGWKFAFMPEKTLIPERTVTPDQAVIPEKTPMSGKAVTSEKTVTPEKTPMPENAVTPEKTVVSSQGYDQLEKLLAARDWQQADEITSELIVKAAGQEEKGYLNAQSARRLLCSDLRTIDSLWGKYSDGRFGFSVQNRIWESVGGKPGKYDDEIYRKFADRVGWRVKGEWQEYNEISYSLNAQPGHLPARGYWEVVRSEGGIKEGYKDVYSGSDYLGVGSGRHMLFSRVKTCK